MTSWDTGLFDMFAVYLFVDTLDLFLVDVEIWEKDDVQEFMGTLSFIGRMGKPLLD